MDTKALHALATQAMQMSGKTREALYEACKRGHLRMTVPVQPNDDDILIDDQLRALPVLAEAVVAAIELRSAIEKTARHGLGHSDPSTVDMYEFTKCLRRFDAAIGGIGGE